MGKLIAELRRRNVFRVAGVYAVVGWLLAQAAVVLEASLGFPPWFDGVVVVLLLIGFPIAVVFAWAFEMTPEGMKLTANVAEGESIAPKTGRKLDYVIIGGLALVAIMIVADRLMPEKAPPAVAATETAASESTQTASNAGPPAASIAVLPFADLSPGKDQEYFSDGMSEEILNVLAKADGLTVASRTSSFQFKGRDIGIPAIAKELNVRHILEGSVRKAGAAIRITAQLIDASTDAHLWSDTFDRPLTAENIFAIQDEIARAIVAALREHLDANLGDAAPVAVQTHNVDAYDLYLKGRALFQARRDLGEADQLLTRALEIDPRFSGALAIRAVIHQFGGEYGIRFADESGARRMGRAYAEEALAADPANSLAIAVVALSHLYDHMEGTGEEPYEKIFASFERALELDPKDSNALNWLGISYSFVGNHAEAVEIWNRCAELDPALAACRSNLAMGYLSLGQKDAANSAIDAAVDAGVISLSPGMLAALADLRRRDAFMFQATNAPALRGWRNFGALYDAMIRPGEDHRELAAELKAFLKETGASVRTYSLLNSIGDYERPLLLTYHWIPAMRAYRRSPEFKAHMTASDLPDYWRKHGFPPQCRPIGKDDFECE